MTGRVAATAYVGSVAALATFGFASDSTGAILLATALALPCGLPALVGYYAAYGLLALAPGANPDRASGAASCPVEGRCESSSGGDAAAWFVVCADVLGVAALTAAALANVLLGRWVRSGLPRTRAAAPEPGPRTDPGR